ncbi:MAG: DUF3806 domain-containing protein [Cellvibrio sp.]|uniref:DUF3806 domain-containing protein n=1 Tax=Cellvibrio sp. TaxID=1965322 RepID=UPI0031A2CF98
MIILLKRLTAPLISSLLIALCVPCVFAQGLSNAATVHNLGWIDENQMEQDAAKINELTLSKIGTPIRRDLGDLETLQKLIDQNLVAKDDYKTQQSMGIVLGNIMQADFPDTLVWQIYEDNIGRSRALCVKETNHCLFPITMLSRRIELGSKPDVKKVYADAIALMEKHLPQLPYGGGIRYRLPRTSTN